MYIGLDSIEQIHDPHVVLVSMEKYIIGGNIHE